MQFDLINSIIKMFEVANKTNEILKVKLSKKEKELEDYEEGYQNLNERHEILIGLNNDLLFNEEKNQKIFNDYMEKVDELEKNNISQLNSIISLKHIIDVLSSQAELIIKVNELTHRVIELNLEISGLNDDLEKRKSKIISLEIKMKYLEVKEREDIRKLETKILKKMKDQMEEFEQKLKIEIEHNQENFERKMRLKDEEIQELKNEMNLKDLNHKKEMKIAKEKHQNDIKNLKEAIKLEFNNKLLKNFYVMEKVYQKFKKEKDYAIKQFIERYMEENSKSKEKNNK